MSNLTRRFLFVMTFVFCAGQVMAKAEQEGRYFVHLRAHNAEERGEIASHIHIDSIIEDSVYSLVNRFDYEQIKLHFADKLIDSHFLAAKYYDKALPGRHAKANQVEFPAGDEAYHTYSEVMAKLSAWSKEYPEITSLFDIGKTYEGLIIPGIRITAKENRQSKNFGVPGIAFIGAHHAREHLSTEVPMGLIEHLLKGYRTNPEIKNLIDNRDIYIIPMLNADGAMYDIIGKRYKMWRKNRMKNKDNTFGVDLNRNYGFGWGTGGSSNSPSSDVYMGPKPFSEPETNAVKKFVEEHANLRVLLSFHSYSELILYPWGGKNDGIGGKDEEVFSKMAKTMSAWNNYTPEQASDLYIASGDTCDWAYGEHGIFCFTFELTPKNGFGGGGFYPGASVIGKVTNSNIRPALYLIDKAEDPYSVLGE